MDGEEFGQRENDGAFIDVQKAKACTDFDFTAKFRSPCGAHSKIVVGVNPQTDIAVPPPSFCSTLARLETVKYFLASPPLTIAHQSCCLCKCYD